MDTNKIPDNITERAKLNLDAQIINETKGIMQVTAAEPNVCSCNTCKDMCRHTPCIGTPSQMAKLYLSGYGDRLELAIDTSCVPFGLANTALIMSKQKEDGSCTFLTSDGLCELHDKGLKPLEGILATCKITKIESHRKPIHLVILAQWHADYNKEIVMLLIQLYKKLREEAKR